MYQTHNALCLPQRVTKKELSRRGGGRMDLYEVNVWTTAIIL